MISSTEVHGARLLREIAAEEGSLEDLLKNLRAALIPNLSRTGIPDLDSIWQTHGGKLSITGRTLPLLHHILIHLVSPSHLNGTIALVDLTGRFSPSHLLNQSSTSSSSKPQPGNQHPEEKFLQKADLQHIHVFRPTKSNLAATLASIESYMLYGSHRSHGREWLGVIVNGGVGGDINLGWRGWLRVERESVGKFGEGVSVEEVFWGERGRRAEVVDQRGWRAVDVSAGGGRGGFVWR
ncbi:hypothetical protein ONS95_006041 [Cadophora gregata]|uniref:uncharacterized protein n=1 Tax=Cadophora gregata TaxID=51156 RepID=UPI0026DC313A|nr:uncharacterized protein ONS95_006041 [Cadophora gregata]KAK0102421.1 hypothetical protein ONS95_006041 [Cadophora gregata]